MLLFIIIIYFFMVVSLFRIIKFYHCLKFKLNLSPTPNSTQIHFSLLLAFNCGTKYKPIKRIERKKKKKKKFQTLNSTLLFFLFLMIVSLFLHFPHSHLNLALKITLQHIYSTSQV